MYIVGCILYMYVVAGCYGYELAIAHAEEEKKTNIVGKIKLKLTDFIPGRFKTWPMAGSLLKNKTA